MNDLVFLKQERQDFQSAEKVSRNDRLVEELDLIEREVRDSQLEMERIESLVNQEDKEIEGIQRKIREVERVWRERQSEEWEWYRKEVVR